jgi:predicted small lipoprotein YifL
MVTLSGFGVACGVKGPLYLPDEAEAEKKKDQEKDKDKDKDKDEEKTSRRKSVGVNATLG